ncbi:DNA mismatch repair endonuclease MutL [Leyella stercorea]|uniref:DNA mismatch repair endonuclease MutL n=1 Tax=Leyella stercorea TaxID=363265 RepID=UPI00266B9A66|nr:DNA mismatch repair endonuclease MutL [Leyella stercorea]
MNDIIQLLPDSVANQIAAGEVIQRPASVIKELVENSIDAGATLINVVCVDSGRTSIQVTDNGKGMSETDARLSFERHATSKIRQADDLFNLHTMGFRGEALASIAAVAQVELRTRRPDDDLGTALSIAGSRFVSQEPVQCPVGCNFTISNLFYNVPVRRKFLKSNTTELNNIVTAFERIALVYPDVAFTLYNNQTELYNLKAGGLRQRIVDVIGKKINQHLLPIDIDTTMCKISGFVGKPESARKKGVRQFFFVNGRYMKHPYFHKAIMTAYERLVPEGEQIPYFIYFTVNPTDIDVNIHPTKTEIKFENEQTVWQILTAAVRDAVGMFSDVTAIEFDTEGKPDIPALGTMPQTGVSAPKVQYNPTYNPFNETPTTHSNAAPDNWEQLYEGLGSAHTRQQQTPSLFGTDAGSVIQSRSNAASKSFADNGIVLSQKFAQTEERSTMPEGPTSEATTPKQETSLLEEKSPTHYQYKGQYIMTAVKSGLMIIDQYRAHTRILYEGYLDQMQKHRASSQKPLFPDTIHFSPADKVVAEAIMPELQNIGFELTPTAEGDYSITAVPSGLDGLDYTALLQDLVASAREKTTSAIDDINHSIALELARNAAVAYGQVLTNAEMENIVNSLFTCSNFSYTPDGKKILTMLHQNELEHLFGT